MPISIPSYEEAHRSADTIVPRELWTRAHADLGQLDLLFEQLMTRYDATMRIDGGPKHPYPRRQLLKRMHGDTLTVGIGLDPKSMEDDRRYTIGVGRSPRQRFFRRWRPETWTPVATVTAQDLAEQRSVVVALIERAAADAFHS